MAIKELTCGHKEGSNYTEPYIMEQLDMLCWHISRGLNSYRSRNKEREEKSYGE